MLHNRVCTQLEYYLVLLLKIDSTHLLCNTLHYIDPGPAFTLIYVVAGLPLARLADTRSRSLVLIIGLVFWSVMVLLTGFAMVFWQLILLRIMLGIGEVWCMKKIIVCSNIIIMWLLSLLQYHIWNIVNLGTCIACTNTRLWKLVCVCWYSGDV